MEYGTNPSDTVRSAAPRKARLFPCAAALVLAIVILYVTLLRLNILSAEDVSGFLRNLSCLASVFLQGAIGYFFIEAAGVLQRIKRQPHNSTEKRGGKRPAAEHTSPIPTEKNRESVPGDPLAPKEPLPSCQQEDRISRRQPNIDIPLDDKKPEASQEQVPDPPASKVRFDFQDRKSSLESIECGRLAPVYLRQVDNGMLEGTEVGFGKFEARPVEECLTERNLKYSIVTVCFEINGLSPQDRKVQVEVQRPAILREVENGLYELIENGVLVVTATVE